MAWHEARTGIGGVAFDRDAGIGAVPDGAEIEHRGATVLMRPSTYLLLAAPLAPPGPRPASRAFLATALARGAPLAPPFLKVDHPDMDVAGVWGHEGRHRMAAVLAARGDIPVPVHLLSPPRRARGMDGAWLGRVSSRLLDQAGRSLVEGPLFLAARVDGRTLDLHDGSAPVSARPFAGFAGTRLQADALCLLAGDDPCATLREAVARGRAEAEALAERLEALGHRAGPEAVAAALDAAARGRDRGMAVAALLGAERLERHAAAAVPAPAP